MADKTSKQRQSRRTSQLDAFARRAGYKSWSNYGTEILHKRAVITKKEGGNGKQPQNI